MSEIVEFKRVVYRGGDPKLQITIGGKVYVVTLTPITETSLVKLIAGGPCPVVIIGAEVEDVS